jgi:hypothetical protein
MCTPEEYRKQTEEYQKLIRGSMKKWNLDALNATMRLAEEVQNEGDWKPSVITDGLFAAYVEGLDDLQWRVKTKPEKRVKLFFLPFVSES